MRFKTVLPSSHGGLGFTAILAVSWKAGRQIGSVGTEFRREVVAMIRASVRTQAAETTRQCGLLDPASARDLLVAKLSARQSVSQYTGIQWRLVRVRLRVGKSDRARAVEQDHALANERARLGRDRARLDAMSAIIRDPVKLCAWWLRLAPSAESLTKEQIKNLVEVAREIAAVPPAAGSRPSADWLVEFAAWFWSDLDKVQQTLFMEKIGETARLVGGSKWFDRIDSIRESIVEEGSKVET
ncbi:hypothetical protein [Saccharopolyspora sp. NPDC002376]